MSAVESTSVGQLDFEGVLRDTMTMRYYKVLYLQTGLCHFSSVEQWYGLVEA